MLDDRHGFAVTAALHPLAGVGERLLEGTLGDAQALMADSEPRAVHHREHAAHAVTRLADQPADRTFVVAIGHDAGRARLHAEFVLERDAAQVVALPQGSVLPGQEFGDDEQRQAFRAGGRTIDAGQHEMDDVLRQIVLAVGDEHLGAIDPVLVAIGHSAGAQGTDVRARLRVDQAHRAGPAAAGQSLAI